MNDSNALIRLEGLGKVFYTDEVETHALSDIHLRDQEGRVHRDLRALGLRQVDAALDPGPARLADRRHLQPERRHGAGPGRRPARAHPQPRDRLHLPELQPDRRPHRLRERRAAAHLPRHARGRAQGAHAEGARARGHGAPRQAPAEPALGRSAAARGRGARARGRALDPARGRAHREPRLEERRGGDGAAARPAPRGLDDLHGHPRQPLLAARRAHRPPLRRPRGERGGGGSRPQPKRPGRPEPSPRAVGAR